MTRRVWVCTGLVHFAVGRMRVCAWMRVCACVGELGGSTSRGVWVWGGGLPAQVTPPPSPLRHDFVALGRDKSTGLAFLTLFPLHPLNERLRGLPRHELE